MLKSVLGILLIFIFLTTPIWGAGIQATPPEFKYILNPGEQQEKTLTVINTGKTPINVEIFPKKLFKHDGKIEYFDDGIAQSINIQDTHFILKPYEHHSFTFKITAPLQKMYNEEIGAILIHSSLSPTSNIFLDIAIPLYVHITGPITESIHIIKNKVEKWIFSGSNAHITTEIKNNGNKCNNITSTTEIKGITGKYTTQNNINIYPSEKTNLTAIWHSNLWDFGIFTTHTTIHYNEQNISFEDKIIVIPWWILILTISSIIYIIHKKRRVIE